MLCCTLGCWECQVNTAQIGRKIPTKGSYYSLCGHHKKQYLLGLWFIDINGKCDKCHTFCKPGSLCVCYLFTLCTLTSCTLSSHFSCLTAVFLLFTLKPWPQNWNTKQLFTSPKNRKHTSSLHPTQSGPDSPPSPVLALCYSCSSALHTQRHKHTRTCCPLSCIVD